MLVLKQNFPNPVSNSTTISFSIPANSKYAKLKIYNILGQLVKSYSPDVKNNNHFDYIWDCKDNDNKQVASGVYFYRLSTDKKNINKKMILLR